MRTHELTCPSCNESHHYPTSIAPNTHDAPPMPCPKCGHPMDSWGVDPHHEPTNQTRSAANGHTLSFDRTHTGTDGSGNTVYLVYSFDGPRCVHIEYFHNPSEAQAWFNHA